MTLRTLRPSFLRGNPRRLAVVALCFCSLGLLAGQGLMASLALFTDGEGTGAAADSQAIFSGQRDTPAFDVADRSSGSEVNVSSPFMAGSDSLTATTAAWSTAMASDRYLEFDLNAPLPAGMNLTSPAFTFRFASSAAGATACYYFEVRRISTGAVLATHGSGGTPTACVTGTAQSASSTTIASVTSTAISNDLRIRVFGRDSGSNAMVIDRAVVTADTAYAAVTLYPVVFRDAADTTLATHDWGLAGP